MSTSVPCPSSLAGTARVSRACGHGPLEHGLAQEQRPRSVEGALVPGERERERKRELRRERERGRVTRCHESESILRSCILLLLNSRAALEGMSHGAGAVAVAEPLAMAARSVAKVVHRVPAVVVCWNRGKGGCSRQDTAKLTLERTSEQPNSSVGVQPLVRTVGTSPFF